ncbi:MAG: hypothetical protein COX80_04370 [Candidatus Magasanikbacteria bacterium CG_4_10_14_0_2_um_filter_33_14]|uniref:N-acetyltransferase domain-containing protein n=1 Tax=Candidatus Magasanikbacteria bacterium CG_4_10_14_0_2_um_filter_33_14 TaxID=1974636 RepID=A0A2M7V9I6_9BACT|nr:MAG: hypothetical protein COX80_04370 [Candidatus Magasanikbacteria bacterium CG_4_10_14_0_2_um_filter_33_14]
MKEIAKINNFSVYFLDEETAQKYSAEISALADEIPMNEKGHFNIMAKEKDGRILHEKFKHSLIVFDKEKIIAGLISYEREPEQNENYKENLLYINMLSVHPDYRKQGLARNLFKIFFENNKKFFYLKGKVKYAMQTNMDDWNKHVQDFYKSLGFKQVGTKDYDDHTDMVFKRSL